MEKITIKAHINAPLHHVWACWTEPEHITQWNAASEDWCCPSATNDLRTGGTFIARMEARDKSMGFDFGGTYTDVVEHAHIAYIMGDQRTVEVTFEEKERGVEVTETFDPETQNSIERQRAGWQSILDNFKRHAEATAL